MSRLLLTRRLALLMPVLLAACSGGEDDTTTNFAPLRYNYLPPIELNVASIAIEQRFVSAGVPPDVTGIDPMPPAEALKAMANDRLMAFGTSNKATFVILDAGLVRNGDVITGTMAVRLTISDDGGNQLGFAEAQVRSQHTGSADPLRTTLYEMTKSMMSDMNIEFEYRVRQNLKPWLTSTAAPGTPVEQTPLNQPGSSGQPGNPQPGTPPPGTPQPGAPQPGAPQPDALSPANPSSASPPNTPSPDVSAPSSVPPPMPLGSGAD
jgi:hypothetical protein